MAADDLASAQLIVALKEAEHRPLMTERHPAWAEKVEYWTVHDIDFATPAEALPQIEERVLELIGRLAGQVKGAAGGDSVTDTSAAEYQD